MPSHGLSLSYENLTTEELIRVSMPSHGLSLSPRPPGLPARLQRFNALTRAKPILSEIHNGQTLKVSMPSHGLSLSIFLLWRGIDSKCFNALTRAKPISKYAQKLFFSTYYLSAHSYYTSKFPVRQSPFTKFYNLFSLSLHVTLVRISPISVLPLRPQQHKYLKIQAFSTGANRSATISANLFFFQISASCLFRISKAP